MLSISSALALEGELKNLTIHATALEGNLLEDSADLSVGVYLPPGYEVKSSKKYPVLYWLHGYSGKGKNTGKAGRFKAPSQADGICI